MKQVRMSLLENAYDFLNDALRSAERAGQDRQAWKFAVLHVVQAIELLLKARLQADSLAVNGADPSLREACPWLPLAALGPSNREPARVPVPRAAARRHHRLQGTCPGRGRLQRWWHFDQKDCRATRREAGDAEWICLRRRPPARRAVSAARLPRSRERRLDAYRRRGLLRPGRQPHDVL